MTTKRLIGGVLIAAGLVIGTPGIAQARPVYSQDDARALHGEEEEYCPIENRSTTFQLRSDGTGYSHIECMDEPVQPRHEIKVKRQPTWWNPWTWF